jgi:hypothetical protein
MNTVWTKNLKTPKEREDFESLLHNSVRVLTRLREILDEEENELNREELKTVDFDTGSWAYKAAFRLGQKHRIKKLKELIEMTKN